jgi:outer membrane receptor protein involved in Fe transport
MKDSDQGMSKIAIVITVWMLCAPAFASQVTKRQSLRVEGVVLDQTGAPIADAEVALLTKADVVLSTRTETDGTFVLESLEASGGWLTVRAHGFETLKRAWRTNDRSKLEITLAPASPHEQVAVTASRTEARLSETVASVLVLSSETLSTTAAVTLDDALRQVPGFSLFRRSGSRTANPTSQGVSLRGVGPSGASRAVVLADGVPLNDPFGGWIYWGRMPRESISRIEVLRGGASDLYGSAALGGVINVFTKDPDRGPNLSLEADYGNQQTPNASLYASTEVGKWGASLAGEVFQTDGYIIVDERERGPVDTPAGSKHTTLDLMVERELSQTARVFTRGSLFGEVRRNGTELQRNRTHIRQLSGGADWQSSQVGSFEARVYGSTQVYDQDFSAVAADRRSETLTRKQRVPSQAAGFTFQLSRALGQSSFVVAGIDGRAVRGSSDETVFAGGRATSTISAGGRERILGVFGQGAVHLTPKLIVTAGGRFDRWSNRDGLSVTRALTPNSSPVVTNFADQIETAFSPRASLLYQITDSFSLGASAYRAFRAPTLNELYRSFRVGDVLTLANEHLRAERLTGGEAAASFRVKQINIRSVAFWSEIVRPVANVTLRVSPGLITRQRQNLGRTRSRGIELDATRQLGDSWSLSTGYAFTDATVLEFPANTSLEGLLVPQVPRHQLTAQARYTNPSIISLGLQVRALGQQFEDDQNQFRLDSYLTVDALAARPITRHFELFVAAENIFNQKYMVGRTPVTTNGPQRLARIGFRVRLGGQ